MDAHALGRPATGTCLNWLPSVLQRPRRRWAVFPAVQPVQQLVSGWPRTGPARPAGPAARRLATASSVSVTRLLLGLARPRNAKRPAGPGLRGDGEVVALGHLLPDPEPEQPAEHLLRHLRQRRGTAAGPWPCPPCTRASRLPTSAVRGRRGGCATSFVTAAAPRPDSPRRRTGRGAAAQPPAAVQGDGGAEARRRPFLSSGCHRLRQARRQPRWSWPAPGQEFGGPGAAGAPGWGGLSRAPGLILP